MGGAQVTFGVGEGKWGDECSDNGEDGKRLRSKLEKINRRSFNDEGRELTSVFHKSHQK